MRHILADSAVGFNKHVGLVLFLLSIERMQLFEIIEWGPYSCQGDSFLLLKTVIVSCLVFFLLTAYRHQAISLK